ncbi:mucin-2-like [Meleagris gallopavo]|uniref:mucin-2-like n=1 Tax=Meleagris gallopavo TaxID=9103 RepID=UPI0005499FFE|nr:mucin-2-like [Meleagris gallopavo]
MATMSLLFPSSAPTTTTTGSSTTITTALTTGNTSTTTDNTTDTASSSATPDSSSTTTVETSTTSTPTPTGKDGQSLQERLMRTFCCVFLSKELQNPQRQWCVALPGCRCHFSTSMGKVSGSSIPPDGSYPISCPVPQRTVVVAETPISNPGRKTCSLRGRARAGNAPLLGTLILLCQTALTAQSCQLKCGELFYRETHVCH